MTRAMLAAVAMAFAGCSVGNDYATVANAFAEQSTANSIRQLETKHDTEMRAYFAAFCGQPRIGAIRRALTPQEIMAYLAFCNALMAKDGI